MNWQDLLKRPQPRQGKAKRGAKTKVKVTELNPPGFGPRGRLLEGGARPVPQETEVTLKDQVMGGSPVTSDRQ